jgi:hypothetical protein
MRRDHNVLELIYKIKQRYLQMIYRIGVKADQMATSSERTDIWRGVALKRLLSTKRYLLYRFSG